MAGFELDLKDGVTLCATHVPGREKPYLGIRQGMTFIALAEFLSDKDLRFLREVLESRLIVVQPIAPNPELLSNTEPKTGRAES